MLSQRILNLKPSPTLALAAKAKELKDQGHDVISLTVGEPDWDTLPSAKEAGMAAIRNGATKYTPANGIPELRQAICAQTNKELGLDYKPDQVTVSAGGKFIIFAALQAVVDPGDEVIVPAPYWVSYPVMVELAEGKPVIVSCGAESDFKLTAPLLKKAMNNKTKVVILNSPSNPTGCVYTRQELEDIADVIKKFPKVLVLSDDIYNRLVFSEEGLAPHILHVAPELAERTLVVNGASKTFSMTGWRVGWAVGPKPIIQGMTNYQSQSVSCAAGFCQEAVVAALKAGDTELNAILPRLKSRRDYIFQRLSELPHVKVGKPGGAFYAWPDFSAYHGKKWKGKPVTSSKEFAQYLLESKMVAVVPGNEFGADGYQRISFAVNELRMGQAVDRIAEFLREID